MKIINEVNERDRPMSDIQIFTIEEKATIK